MRGAQKVAPWTAIVGKRNPFRFRKESDSVGLIPIATKRTSRFAAIILGRKGQQL